MNEKNEELRVDIQKKAIDKIINHLSQQGNESYYESTMNICREVHHIIHNENLLSYKEKEAVKDLSAEDIQTLISYNTSCC